MLSHLRHAWLPALVLAVLLPILAVMREEPLDLKSANIDTSYNIVDLKAPAITGPTLRAFSYIASRSILSPYILRALLKRNGLVKIRNLAAKCSHLPPTHNPIHRAGAEQMRYHERKYAASRAVLTRGLAASTPLSAGPYYSTVDYNKVYRSGKATPSEVMERVLSGCQKLEHLRIFSSFSPDDVRRQAASSDLRWKAGAPLSAFDGVPIAIKDMIDVAGHSICYGGRDCVERGGDGVAVQRLRAAGAIILGVTVMPEGGVTPLGYSAIFDGPFNPYDVDYYPGGSSGGSAVVVASGLAPLALGFDGGGSIRVPAAMSGVFGLAATYGRVPHDTENESTNIKGGPLAATLVDVALAHVLLGAVEDGSMFAQAAVGQIPPPILSDVAALEVGGGVADLSGIRLGVYWDHFKDSDPEVYEACLAAVRELGSRGAEVVNITIPNLRELHFSHAIKILSEFGMIWEKPFFDPAYSMEANTEITVALGRALSASEVLSAERLRTYGKIEVCEKLFRKLKLDAIVSPTLGLKVPKPMNGFRGYGENNTPLVYKTMRFVPLANFLGLPALSVPVGYEAATGLPIGLQLMGDAWMEHKLIQIAAGLDGGKSDRKQPPSENFWDVLEGL